MTDEEQYIIDTDLWSIPDDKDHKIKRILTISEISLKGCFGNSGNAKNNIS